ncbi:hypothetical protein FALBO_4895 [Fusarium albosuccineum]|uniref:Uncharacterized protein n=1 Tax=Fusarium albosuccineum TaxID=1237068 RepID=A0A8H4LIQ7_9HYPO|nr:hypothetical protein FALBO_4895 [Fusarium albosuccineum]
MQTTMLRALVYSLAIPQCLAAVTWTPIGCDGWDFQGTDIDAIWDNAVELATQSQSQIDLIPKKFSLTGFSGEENRAGANGEMVFGAGFTKHRGLSDDGKAIMEKARSRYDEVLSGLAGTLADMNPKRAFLLCGANGLKEEPIPGSPSPNKVWHAEVNLEVRILP